MSKWRLINLLCFVVFVLATASLVYILGKMDFTAPYCKPWHLSPSEHEDSLSLEYLKNYLILDRKPLLIHYYDTSRLNVFIMVDAWGVPLQESTIKADFSFFEEIPHTFAMHQRLANRNKHAERVEFRNGPENKIYLFGGDSLEYNRPKLVNKIGFKQTLFCQNCEDSLMLVKIDSLLNENSHQLIAWTTQSSRLGDKVCLHKSLKLIAKFAKRHPNVRFVVQGTHRPVLGTPEVRNSYKSHWVPVAILN